MVYGFSPNVVPRPPDWGDHIKITGYWFLDSEAGWQPPTDLADFLAAGPPPVFVGFGSISTSKPEETTELAPAGAFANKATRAVVDGLGRSESD